MRRWRCTMRCVGKGGLEGGRGAKTAAPFALAAAESVPYPSLHTHTPLPLARSPPQLQWFYNRLSPSDLLAKLQGAFGGVSADEINQLITAWSGNPPLSSL